MQVKYVGNAFGKYKNQIGTVVAKDGKNRVKVKFGDDQPVDMMIKTLKNPVVAAPAEAPKQAPLAQEEPKFPSNVSPAVAAAKAATKDKTPGVFAKGDLVKYTGVGNGSLFATGHTGKVMGLLQPGTPQEVSLVLWDHSGKKIGAYSKDLEKIGVAQKPTEVLGFHIGDKVSYHGESDILKGDYGTIVNFWAKDLSIIGVKFVKLNKTRWVSPKLLKKMDAPSAATPEELPKGPSSTFEIMDKVKTVGMTPKDF